MKRYYAVRRFMARVLTVAMTTSLALQSAPMTALATDGNPDDQGTGYLESTLDEEDLLEIESIDETPAESPADEDGEDVPVPPSQTPVTTEEAEPVSEDPAEEEDASGDVIVMEETSDLITTEALGDKSDTEFKVTFDFNGVYLKFGDDAPIDKIDVTAEESDGKYSISASSFPATNGDQYTSETGNKVAEAAKWTFGGWYYIDSEGAKKEFTIADIENTTDFTTLYATWTTTVEVTAFTGATAVNVTGVVKGSKISETFGANKTTGNGWTIEGYYKDSGYTTNNKYAEDATVDATGMKVFFKQQTEVTFDISKMPGAKAVEKQTIDYNGTVKKPADPASSDAIFTKWTSDEAGSQDAFDFTTPLTEDNVTTEAVTLYAQSVSGFELQKKVGDNYPKVESVIELEIGEDNAVTLRVENADQLPEGYTIKWDEIKGGSADIVTLSPDKDNTHIAKLTGKAAGSLSGIKVKILKGSGRSQTTFMEISFDVKVTVPATGAVIKPEGREDTISLDLNTNATITTNRADASGNKVQLVAYFTAGKDADEQDIVSNDAAKWTYKDEPTDENEKVISVNEKTGLVTALREGTATVVLTATDEEGTHRKVEGKDVTAEITIKVVASAREISFKQSSYELDLGKDETKHELKLSDEIVFDPAEVSADEKELTWSFVGTVEESVATLADGVVEGKDLKDGAITTITVKATAKNGKSATTKVNLVKHAQSYKLMSGSKEGTEVEAGGTIKKGDENKVDLFLVTTPEKITDAITWSISDKNIATLSNTTGTENTLTFGTKGGEATITVKVGKDEAKTYTVLVEKGVTAIKLDSTSKKLDYVKANHKTTLKATLTPADAMPNRIKWEVTYKEDTKDDDKAKVFFADADGNAITKKSGDDTVPGEAYTKSGETVTLILNSSGVAVIKASAVDTEDQVLKGKDNEDLTVTCDLTLTASIEFIFPNVRVDDSLKTGGIASFESTGDSAATVTYDLTKIAAEETRIDGITDQDKKDEAHEILSNALLLIPTWEPTDEVDPLKFTYKPSNKNVVDIELISEKGELQIAQLNPKKVGTATITVTETGSNKSGVLTVIVKQSATDIEIQDENGNAFEGEIELGSSARVKAKLEPATSTDDVVWKAYKEDGTSDAGEDVVLETLNGGLEKITPNKAGKYVIKAFAGSAESAVSKSVNLNVIARPEGITLSNSKVAIEKVTAAENASADDIKTAEEAKKVTLTATLNPTGISDGFDTVAWKVEKENNEDPAIVRLSAEEGANIDVIPVNGQTGTAKVVATVKGANGKELKAECVVIIAEGKVDVTSISVSDDPAETTFSLEKGETAVINIKYNDGTYAQSPTNTALVATLDDAAKGKVKVDIAVTDAVPGKEGTDAVPATAKVTITALEYVENAKVTVASEEKSDVKVEFTVSVAKMNATSLKLDQSVITLKPGESAQLTAALLPSNADDVLTMEDIASEAVITATKNEDGRSWTITAKTDANPDSVTVKVKSDRYEATDKDRQKLAAECLVIVEGTDVTNNKDTAPVDGNANILTKNEDEGDASAKLNVWVAGVDGSVEYTGKAIKQADVRVYEGDTLLPKKSYTISYKNNKNVGKAQMLVTLKGNYNIKKIPVEFEITKADISNGTPDSKWVASLNRTTSGKLLKSTPKIKVNGLSLKLNRDFTISYENDLTGAVTTDGVTEPGDYTITLTGIGNYSGTYEVSFKIYEKDTRVQASKWNVALKKKGAVEYTGEDLTEADVAELINVTYKKEALEYGTDYEVVLNDNMASVGKHTFNVVAADDSDKYVGAKTFTIEIAGAKKLGKTTFGTWAKSMPYTGLALTNGDPDKQISYKNSKSTGPEEFKKDGYVEVVTEKPENELDNVFYVTYSNNENAGTAKAVFTGYGYFAGVNFTKTFKITPYDVNGDRLTITIDEEPIYAKGGAKTTVSAVYSYTPEGGGTTFTKQLTEGVDYKLSYSKTNKKAGQAQVIFKGIGNFTKQKGIGFVSQKQDLENLTMVVPDKVEGTGWKATPVVYDTDGKTLKAGAKNDFTVKYYDEDGKELTAKSVSILAGEYDREITVVATATAAGSYTGEIEGTYRLIKKGYDISKAKFTIANQTYRMDYIEISSEKDITKAVLGKTNLKFGEDYEIVEGSYVNNYNAGTAKVTIRGIGQYGGTKVVTFKILKQTKANR